jgi:hypothetical protein
MRSVKLYFNSYTKVRAAEAGPNAGDTARLGVDIHRGRVRTIRVGDVAARVVWSGTDRPSWLVLSALVPGQSVPPGQYPPQLTPTVRS